MSDIFKEYEELKIKREESGKKNHDFESFHKLTLEEKPLFAGKLIHYRALNRYHKLDFFDAIDFVKKYSYDELNKITHIDYYVNLAIEGIEKYLFKNGMQVSDFSEVVKGIDEDPEFINKYLEHVGNYIYSLHVDDDILPQVKSYRFEKLYLDISQYMNARRIQENISDDFFDEITFERKVLRALPLQLAGFEESENYMNILEPIVRKLGLPSATFGRMFYEFTVDDFFVENNIKDEDDIKRYIKNIGNTYEPLKVENAPDGKKKLAEERLAFLTDDSRIDEIVKVIMKSNRTAIRNAFDNYKDGSLFKTNWDEILMFDNGDFYSR